MCTISGLVGESWLTHRINSPMDLLPANYCGKYLLGLENVVGQISRQQVGSGQERDQVAKGWRELCVGSTGSHSHRCTGFSERGRVRITNISGRGFMMQPKDPKLGSQRILESRYHIY